MQAAFGVASGLVGFLGVVFPHPAGFNEVGLIAIQASAVVMGLALIAAPEKVSISLLSWLPPLAVGMTTLAIWFTHDPTSAYALFYLWPTLFALYFLSSVQFALTSVLAVVSYSVLLALMDAPDPTRAGAKAPFLVLVVGTLVVAGSLVLYVRFHSTRLLLRLMDAARSDLLTGLPNARGIADTLRIELDRAELVPSYVSVLIIDLDRFRAVNEEFGHAATDEVLKVIGRELQDGIRTIDAVGRTGPAEFTVVLPQTDEDIAFLTAERLLAGIRETDRGDSPPLTASIGVAVLPRHARNAEELLRRAGRAVEAAQRLGGDRVVGSSPLLNEIVGAHDGGTSGEGSAHLATLLSLAQTLDLRDSDIAEHSVAVGSYASLIARELGLNQFRVERIRLAGILHDIGKVNVPDEILRKPGPLTGTEWEAMRKHPEAAARILGARELSDIRSWILASHERLDGSGYPRGLGENEIPLEAKILAVADAYAAMLRDTPYRLSLTETEARRELGANTGTQFDPEVVEGLYSGLAHALEASLDEV